MKITYLLFIYLLLSLISCSGREPDIGSIKSISTNSAKRIELNAVVPDSQEKFSMVNLLDSLFIVELSNEQYIAEITEMEVIDERIFIFDDLAQAVFIFDFDGVLRSSIDRKGRGPGEYVKIADMEIDDESKYVLLLDQFNRKILYYDFDGKFVKDQPYPTHARHFYSLEDSHFVIYNDFNSRWGNVNYNLFVTDQEGSVQRSMLPFEDKYRQTDRIKRSYFTAYDQNTANYIGHYDNHWYRVNKDSAWAAYYLDFDNENIPNGVVHDSFEILDEYAHDISNFYENSNYLTFSYTYRKTRYIRYYNKTTQILFDEKLHIPNIVYFNFNFPVKAIYKDFFVNAVDSEYYPQLGEFKGLELVDKRLGPILDGLRELDETDNAVLFFFKLKDFVHE